MIGEFQTPSIVLPNECSSISTLKRGSTVTTTSAVPTCIQDLPNEILFMIFSALEDHRDIGRVAQVCMQWYHLATSPVLQLNPKFALDIRYAKLSSGHSQAKQLMDFEEEITAMAISQDGLRMFSASGKSIVVTCLSTGKQLTTLEGHDDVVCAIVMGPSGLIYSGSYDKTIRVWSQDGKLVSTQRGHTATVRSLAVAPNGTRLYSGGYDKVVRIWPLDASGVPEENAAGVKVVTGHKSGVYALAVSHDSTTLYSGAGSKDSKIRVWTADGELLREYEGHAAGVYSLSCDTDGTLYSGSADKLVIEWSNKGAIMQKYRGHRHKVQFLAFNDKRLFSASTDKTIRVWNRQTGDQLYIFNTHDHCASSLALSPVDHCLYSASANKCMKW